MPIRPIPPPDHQNHDPQLVHAFHANTEFSEPFHATGQIFTRFPASTKFNVNKN